MAGAAVGVSHLVQSTRAGAGFGWGLLIFILMANIFKYPFFEYGHRFAASTGKSFLEGYKSLGNIYLVTFLIANIFTAIISIAAVVFVTSALLANLIPSSLGISSWSIVLVITCFLLIAIGKYKILDLFMKIMMSVLVVCTGLSFVLAAIKAPSLKLESFFSFGDFNMTHFPFLIALMGWMPAPVEISVWQSLWIVERNECSKNPLSMVEAKIDFNVGYLLTIFLAVLFCGMGALTMYQTNNTFSDSPADFASQVINLYTAHIGEWAKPVIALTAFTTMFSTTLTLIDAYPRSISEGLLLFKPKLKEKHRLFHKISIVLCCLLSLLVISQFLSGLKALVDTVTIIAFLAAPFFAFLNFKLIRSALVREADRPGTLMNLWSWAGLIFLLGFGLFFLAKTYF